MKNEFYNIEDLNISQLVPNVIDNVLITIYEGYHTIVLPLGMGRISYENWRKGRGAVFSKDVKNFRLNKPHGKYVLLNTTSLNCVARIIDEEEMPDFVSKNLVDGIIGDASYMILKKVNVGESLNDIETFMMNTNLLGMYDIDEHIILEAKNETFESDDDIIAVKSLSLFD